MEFLANIDVADLAAGERFYVDAFALRVGRRFGDDAVELLGGPAPIYLLRKSAEKRAFPGGEIGRDYARHWTPVHLDWVVDDIDAALARALAAGAQAESAVKTNAWGKIVLMADPFGHGFCFIQFLGRGYDEIAEAARPG
jgi:catechol 2,3-dioxygenase-like lactoylglutathione lyase family enzyme